MNLKNLSKGMVIEENFAVISIEKKTASNNKPFLSIELSHPSGNINAKVWQDSFDNVNLAPGKIYHLNAVVDSWRDIYSLVINKSSLVSDEKFEDYVTPIPTLVFDIETAGYDFNTLDSWDQDYLLNTLESYEEDKQKAKTKTGLHPLYGQIVSIGMYNPSTQKGVVFSLSLQDIKLEDADFSCSVFASEKDLLKSFWQTSQKYERFVTYNGSGFDFPFLIIRSAIQKVKVPFEINSRQEKFIDLMQKFRTSRSYRLEALCRALGILNPKEEGTSGEDIAKLFNEGNIKQISNYVSRDAKATSQLYQVWKEYVSGKIIV